MSEGIKTKRKVMVEMTEEEKDEFERLVLPKIQKRVVQDLKIRFATLKTELGGKDSVRDVLERAIIHSDLNELIVRESPESFLCCSDYINLCGMLERDLEHEDDIVEKIDNYEDLLFESIPCSTEIRVISESIKGDIKSLNATYEESFTRINGRINGELKTAIWKYAEAFVDERFTT
jgi:hypothetical protein